jgi:transcriptional regulator with XRE-family HTH domain
MARILGLSPAAMERRLNGRVPLRVDELIAISEHLGIPVARFTEPPEPAECVS